MFFSVCYSIENDMVSSVVSKNQQSRMYFIAQVSSGVSSVGRDRGQQHFNFFFNITKNFQKLKKNSIK